VFGLIRFREYNCESTKIAKIASDYKKWIIVEKNPRIESSDNILFIEGFFDKDFQATPSESSCRFCVFRNNPICPQGV
jgi:hypothetical protein